MPECLLQAYAEQMPRLEAEQARLASLCAAYPHMTKQGAREWLTALGKAARRTAHAADGLFRFNGKPITVRGLRERLGTLLGGGFSQE